MSARNGHLKDLLAVFRFGYRQHIQLDARDALMPAYIMGVLTSPWLAPAHELVWGYIVGPPSSAKTEQLRPLFRWDRAVLLDEATENSLSSAADPDGSRRLAKMRGDDDPGDNLDLLKRLDNKVLVCKDLTAMHGKPQRAAAFFSGLRGAFDGETDKHSGTVGHVKHVARFGFLSAITPTVVDAIVGAMQGLGERTLLFRMCSFTPTYDDDMVRGSQVLASRRTKHLRREQLQLAVPGILESAIAQVAAHGPTGVKHEWLNGDRVRAVKELARIMVSVRTQPAEDTATPRERLERTIQQFGGLCDAVALCSGRREWSDQEVALIRRVVVDTLPSRVRNLLGYVAGKSQSSTRMDYPTPEQASGELGFRLDDWVDRQFRQWTHIGLLRRAHDNRHVVTPEWMEVLGRHGFLGAHPAVRRIVRPQGTTP